jgi:hypothetical protein
MINFKKDIFLGADQHQHGQEYQYNQPPTGWTYEPPAPGNRADGHHDMQSGTVEEMHGSTVNCGNEP